MNIVRCISTSGVVRLITMILLTATILFGSTTRASAYRHTRHWHPREFAYAVGGNVIYQYAIGANGALKALSPPIVAVKPAQTEPGPNASINILIVNPVRPFAYLVWGAQILQCRIQPNGQMSPIAAAPLPLIGWCADMVMDPKGRFLYAVMENSLLQVYRAGGDGRLHPLPSTGVDETFFVAPSDHPMAGVHGEGLFTIDPTGRFLYCYGRSGFVDHSEGGLTRYRIGTSGQLTPVGDFVPDNESTERTGPVIFNPNGRYAYRNLEISSGENVKNLITIWRVGPQGALLPIPSRPAHGDRLLRIVGPTGRWALCKTGWDLRFYRIHRDGTLSSRSPNSQSWSPHATIDPTGRFLYDAAYDKKGHQTVLEITRVGWSGQSQLKSWVEKFPPWSPSVIIQFRSPHRIAVPPGQSTGMQQYPDDTSE